MRLDEFPRYDSGIEPFEVVIDGLGVPVSFRASKQSKHLLVSFHGAVDRKKRTLPVFPPYVPGLGEGVAQLCVSDPSMMLDGEFTMSWYAGHEGFPTQKLLPQLFQKIIDMGQYERIVFFGSSGGGFAALYYSSLFPDSIAVTGIPQTNMHRYYAGHIKRYREGCWPSLTSDEDLAKEVCTDLCQWYAVRRPNTVIYVQSAGDHFHTRTQFAPFLAAISQVENARFIANSGFWGRLGHSGAVPAEGYAPWVQAAFLSPSTEVDDLLVTHRGLTQKAAGPKAPSNSAPARAAGTIAQSDTDTASLLRNYHLPRATVDPKS